MSDNKMNITTLARLRVLQEKRRIHEQNMLRASKHTSFLNTMRDLFGNSSKTQKSAASIEKPAQP